MYTIAKNIKYELIIKNSKFITILIKINYSKSTNDILDKIKKEYPAATHYCYAYIAGNYKKASDDGEPTGTAGIPLLKVLENNNLTNIIAIVIRYFGGIKLGANGLIRAYTKSVSNALKEVNLKELIDGYNIDIFFDYQRQKEINYLLKDKNINLKNYQDTITYNLDIEKDWINILKINKINYKINKEIKIEIN